MIVIVPSEAMETKALSAASAGASAASSPDGSSAWRAKPPPASALTLRNARREGRSSREVSGCRIAALRKPLRHGGDGVADPVIAGASTDVSGHCFGCLGAVHLRLFAEQRRRVHDLPGLAIAALHHVMLEP